MSRWGRSTQDLVLAQTGLNYDPSTASGKRGRNLGLSKNTVMEIVRRAAA